MRLKWSFSQRSIAIEIDSSLLVWMGICVYFEWIFADSGRGRIVETNQMQYSIRAISTNYNTMGEGVLWGGWIRMKFVNGFWSIYLFCWRRHIYTKVWKYLYNAMEYETEHNIGIPIEWFCHVYCCCMSEWAFCGIMMTYMLDCFH